MALVTKNDVTQIFAIQAPSIDLPPTFANYPRGWDTARANNGKPTIKQFNYIQQRTDQNMLWIHQNGAALPYDAAMEYAENAHVVKDGVLQQWDGGAWVKIVENASTTQAGIVQLVNDLTTGGSDKVLTAEQGKLFFDMFFGVKTQTGHQALPKGLIFQWGLTPTSASSSVNSTLSTTFPNVFIGAVAVCVDISNNVIVQANPFSLSQVTLSSWNTSNARVATNVFYFAVGY